MSIDRRRLSPTKSFYESWTEILHKTVIVFMPVFKRINTISRPRSKFEFPCPSLRDLDIESTALLNWSKDAFILQHQHCYSLTFGYFCSRTSSRRWLEETQASIRLSAEKEKTPTKVLSMPWIKFFLTKRSAVSYMTLTTRRHLLHHWASLTS